MSEILASTFVLAVNDIEVSKRFYLEKLGFAEDFSVDGWAFLSRGACKLRLGHCPDAMPMAHVPDHSWFAYLHVRDAAGLYDEIVKNGVAIWHKLADKPWGRREFAIVTPDGHRIVFGESLAEVGR
ncbi:MAG: VOC family protein [Anaerolineae bacterium]|nr:VOC family protein [Anaerolineae bacterium]